MSQPKASPGERPQPNDQSPANIDASQSSGESEAAPRLPHERDESPDSQGTEPRESMKQAKDDLDRGLVDTGKGAAMEKAYQQQRTPAPPPAKR